MNKSNDLDACISCLGEKKLSEMTVLDLNIYICNGCLSNLEKEAELEGWK